MIHSYAAAGFTYCLRPTGGPISRDSGYTGPVRLTTTSDSAVTCPDCKQKIAEERIDEGVNMDSAQETVTVSHLNHSHLGKTIDISLGREGFSATDMIVGVWHQADLVSERGIADTEDSWEIGRTYTTVSLARAGDVTLPPHTVVTVRHTEGRASC